MTWRRIKLEVQEGIGLVTLNFPEKLNAFVAEMRDDFAELAQVLQNDDAIGAVVFTGAGRAFSAGGDIDWIGAIDSLPRFRREYRRVHNFFDELEALEKPVLAAVNGICVGGGVELALSSDLRLAAEDARFGFPELQLGLIPGSGGCSRLVKLVGPAKAKELIFLGRSLDAQEAKRIGLINEVVAPGTGVVEEALKWARELLRRPPLALGMAKQVINNCLNVDTATGRSFERLGQSVLLKTQDHLEGIRAFQEKRKPRFEGR